MLFLVHRNVAAATAAMALVASSPFFVTQSWAACSLCANGDYPSNANNTLSAPALGVSLTCGELAISQLLDSLTSDLCSLVQSLAGIVCGCFGVLGNSTPCSFCYDGSEIPDPGATPESLFGNNCSYAANSIEANLAENLPLCAESQSTVAVECGCPAPPGSCSICPDGGNITNPNAIVSGGTNSSSTNSSSTNLTCNELSAQADTVLAGSAACEAYQNSGSEYCGCVQDCSALCPSDSSLNTTKSITFGGLNETCETLQIMLSFNSTLCSTYEGNFSSACCVNSSSVTPATPKPSPAPTSSAFTSNIGLVGVVATVASIAFAAL